MRPWISKPLGLALGLGALLGPLGDPEPVETIAESDLRAHLAVLASDALEGRDTPSLGLELAARYIEDCLKSYGVEPLAGESYRRNFSVRAPAPVAEDCWLELRNGDGEPRRFELGRDFVPLAGCAGSAEGALAFLGFGIDAALERYDEVPARGLERNVVLILEAEPHHKKRFDGEEVSPHAVLWNKLVDIADAGAAGVIIVRRTPADLDSLPEGLIEPDGDDLAFRHQFGTWVGEGSVARPREKRLPPVVEVDAACGAALLGTDVEELARKSDRSGKPPRFKIPSKSAPVVRFQTGVEERENAVPNVVGVVRGSDPALAEEYVVVGAHFDHVGVDERGRIGNGADDNASGTAAVLELAQALALAPAPRSVILCLFAGEEKGLLGSKAFCADPPVPLERVVAMVNMDMIGRGDTDEVAVLGIDQNPELEDVLKRAAKLSRTGVKKTVVRKGQELWERSDHHSFHERGVPTLFFFEGLPIERNKDYHTWRDTIDKLDFDKMARTTRLVYNTAWLLGSDPKRPPPPGD